ncbi:ABC transporter permease [Gilvimarinus polysaccharolyticus]|uniref:ABC transporter permease n=1 Tax=Gilvimarinus polysaccharolyticus TaxID=863921 RepID=UPI0006739999|nr:ABC transporter permease [Gilvimarinus polysaccharolyticus]
MFFANDTVSALSRYTSLFSMMVKRDISARYKGSLLGLFWSAINPLLLMVVYGFVFGVIFQARWPAQGDAEASFIVLLFCGLIVHMMFSDILTRSTSVVRDNANYVKKVVFPLTIFGGVVSVSALFHFLVSFVVLLLVSGFMGGHVTWHVIFLPVLLLQYLLFCTGVAWLVSVLGVFFKDLTHIIGFISTVFLFTCPIFFPTNYVPEQFQIVLAVNPLTYYVEAVRGVVAFHSLPTLEMFTTSMLVALLTFALGLWFFRKTKGSFADVV